jgi:hypothetical protein
VSRSGHRPCRTVLHSGGDGLPQGVGGTARDAIPGRVQVVVCVLRCQGIKCPYTGVGARASCGCPRARRTPPKGCLDLERGGPHSRGGVEPSSEADPARGGVKASSEADLTRGSVCPSSEADLTRGASSVSPWQAAGATRVAVVLCVCFRCVS